MFSICFLFLTTTRLRLPQIPHLGAVPNTAPPPHPPVFPVIYFSTKKTLFIPSFCFTLHLVIIFFFTRHSLHSVLFSPVILFILFFFTCHSRHSNITYHVISGEVCVLTRLKFVCTYTPPSLSHTHPPSLPPFLPSPSNPPPPYPPLLFSVCVGVLTELTATSLCTPRFFYLLI